MKSRVRRLSNKIKIKNEKCSNEHNKSNLKLMSKARKSTETQRVTQSQNRAKFWPHVRENNNNLTVDLEARYTY